ncbi:MAG: PAS domain S-box protein [Pseudomonadota bacterium]
MLRLNAIERTLADSDKQSATPGTAQIELREAARALPPLLARLQEIGPTDDAFQLRRKEMLLDQVLTTTQAMNDDAYQWYQDASLERLTADQQFQLIAFSVAIALLALLAGLAALVLFQVLRPLQRLDDATVAVSRGDLSVRIDSLEPNELGELSRRFDLMTQALAQSSEQLRRSERQLRAITDNVPAMISHFDSEARADFVNRACTEVYGLTAQQLLGKSVRDVRGEAGYIATKPFIERALNGERVAFESSVVIAGQTRFFQQCYVPDVALDGSIQGYHSLSHEITERKTAELELARQEDRLRSVLTHAPDAFIGIDAGSLINEWNRQAELTFGWRREEVLGRSLAEVLIPEPMRAAHICGMAKFITTGEGTIINRRVELMALHQDGHEIPIELSVAAVRDGAGYAANAFLRDITERKHAEGLLRESERRLRDVTDNIPAMIGHFNTHEHCLFANKTVLKLHGLTAEEAANQTLRFGIGEENYALHEPYVRKVLKGEACSFEGHIQHDGRDAFYQAYLVPDRADTGSVQGFYLMSFDVTKLKTIERKLQSLARFDTLTGLPNRFNYNEKLPEALLRSRRSGESIALMFLDIDRFKAINDSHGHAAGDIVLKEFAKRLVESVRATDTVFRLAGDEFVVMLEHLNSDTEPQFVARKIISQVGSPMDVEGRLLDVTTSIGIAYHDRNSPATTADGLLARADAALYDAKHAGRNTYCMAVALVGSAQT